VANPIAEAFVRLRPDVASFPAETQRVLAQSFQRVSVPPGTQQRLAGQLFGAEFATTAATATTAAASGATFSSAQQAGLASRLFGPGFRNETGRAIQGALVGLGGGQLAAQFAFFGAGGAALAVLGGQLIQATVSAANFERQLEILQQTTGATEEEVAQFADRAEELGRNLELPGATAQDAAEAMLALSKAGLGVEDSMTGAEGALQLAIAAETDIGTAAGIAAAGLNAFDLAGTEATRVADLLAGAADAALGDITDFGFALQQSAAVADQAGLSIDQLVALITELGRQGIIGSDAGTSIRTALLRLVPTTEEAAELMRQLGIEIDKTRTVGEQLPELLDQYKASLAGLSPTLRQAVLQQIFGTDAIRAATVAIEEGGAGLARTQAEIDRTGLAAEKAAARGEGAAGAFADIASEAETAALNVGQGLLPQVTELAEALADVLSVANLAADGIGRLAAVDLGPLGDAGGVLREVFNPANFVFGGLGPRLAFNEIRGLIQGTEDDAEQLGSVFDDIGNSIVASVNDIASAFQTAANVGRLANTLGLTEDELNTIARTVSQQGEQAGFAVGRRFVDGLASGITQDEQKAINAARATLDQIRREGAAQIRETIRSARANLESLGSALGESLADIVELGPIGDRLEELRDALDELEEDVSRRQLRFDLSQAQLDLRDARDAIQNIGVPTPRQRRLQQEFLKPFQERVADAKSSIQEFDLTQQIEQQEELRDAAQKAAREGIDELVASFDEGKISAAEFNRLLERQLAPTLSLIGRENLGITIEREFLANVETLVAQVRELSGFIGRPGTAPGRVISPAATAAEVQRRVAEAQVSLAKTQEDALKVTKEQQQELEIQTGLLRSIVKALGGPAKVVTKPGGRGSSTLPGRAGRGER
jgi:TP901 family phage tail tape measure protein